jgi:DNA-binding MarR family transcriptional regulator
MDFEIAKQIGPTSFLIYHVLKAIPKATYKELIIESGLDENTVRNVVKKLEGARILYSEIVPSKTRPVKMFSLNDETKWLLH